MRHDRFVICNVAENGMGSRIVFDNFRTDVSFMLNPELVKMGGVVSRDTFDLIMDEVE